MTNSAVPSGLMYYGIHLPTLKTLGYSREVPPGLAADSLIRILIGAVHLNARRTGTGTLKVELQQELEFTL